MPFQTYLDKAEEKTGILDCTHERGYGPDTNAGEILARLAACSRQG